jgi:hypothetical protein
LSDDHHVPVRAFVPKLTEPWFCCAEPTAVQLGQLISNPLGQKLEQR